MPHRTKGGKERGSGKGRRVHNEMLRSLLPAPPAGLKAQGIHRKASGRGVQPCTERAGVFHLFGRSGET